MGLFGKSKSSAPASKAQRYAPPPGPPPTQQYYAPPPGPPPTQSQPTRRPETSGAKPSGRENPLAALAKYDTHILIDDSESMELFWDELGSALSTVVAKACEWDTDGVDISFFNNRTVATSHSAQELLSLFRRVEPRKSTPTASALRRVLDPYMDNLHNWEVEGKPIGFPRPKPLNLVILTDGAPDRGENPEEVIVEVGRKLDQARHPPYQLGISFVQIGVDDEAADHLRALDDDLKTKHGIRDMVDTTLFDVNNGVLGEQYILKALLGGMNRQLDKTTI